MRPNYTVVGVPPSLHHPFEGQMTIGENDADCIVPPFYWSYREAGFSPALFASALCYALLSCVGVLLNLSIVWVTIRKRHSATFTSASCVLIATNSACNAVHQAGHLLFFGVVASARNFVPVAAALPCMALPLVAAFASLVLLSLIGLDRLFAILAPIKYRNVDKCVYLSLCHLAAFGVAGAALGHTRRAVGLRPSCPTTGYIPELLLLPGNEFSSHLMTSLNLATALPHCLLAAIVKLKKSRIKIPVGIDRLYASIALIIALNLVSYAFSALAFAAIMPWLGTVWSPSGAWFFGNLLTLCTLNATIAMNAPILYWMSSDYRTALDREFPVLRRIRPFGQSVPFLSNSSDSKVGGEESPAPRQPTPCVLKCDGDGDAQTAILTKQPNTPEF